MPGKSITTQFTEGNTQQIVKMLAETAGRLEGLADGLEAERLRLPLGRGERSILETVGHLLHCEAVDSQAIYTALLVREPEIPDIHPERQYGNLLHLETLEFEDQIAYFKTRRLLCLRVLRPLKEAQWGMSVRQTGRKRQDSVYSLARAMSLHEAEHLDDLDRKAPLLRGR